MSKIPLQPLSGFVQAARARNLSRAAEQMHITVSALSHQLRQLEQRLGRRLFERGPRGVVLTQDGEDLYARIAPHLDAIEQAVRPFSAPRGDVLTLSLLGSLASSWLVPRLPDFLSAHAQIEINLQSSVGLVDFGRDVGVDAALRFGPGQWPGVTAVHLFDDWITPTASPQLLRKYGKPTLESLSKMPLLRDPSNRWVAWFAQFGGREPTRYVAGFNDSETLHRAAAEGLGVALGRMTLARPLIDGGHLQQMFTQRLKSDFSHYLVYPPRSERHPALLAFRDWVAGQAAEFSHDVAVDSTAPSKRARKRRTQK